MYVFFPPRSWIYRSDIYTFTLDLLYKLGALELCESNEPDSSFFVKQSGPKKIKVFLQPTTIFYLDRGLS